MNDDLNEKLINSAWNGDLDTINILLINNVADVNYLTINNFSALTLADWNGHLNIVKTLLENDANINHANIFGNTAFISCWK
ncbi:ankyrin repeat domain-containing protein [Spiroplasma endosymbiont of Acasis viretata]|uniref:ankyrin repeat domain-containing protein n=1 Tax=Spiroplasma endosymbiont of Acasis viretata TaxID=3066306 RepID=UPI00313BBDD8